MLLEKVQQTINRHGLLGGNELVVVGVSGGPDSVALLHLLWRLREAYRMRLHVAHLNHRLRAEAEADVRFVQELAAELALPCAVEVAEVRTAAARGESLEEAARRIRYEFLERLANALGAMRVAVGHTADDQAETVFMHLARGSGTTGLAAMAPSRPLGRAQLIRPLLSVWRDEVMAYLREQGLSWREDVSNQDLRFWRNRIRLQILPWLEAQIPGFRRSLVRMAELLREDEEALDVLARELFKELAAAKEDGVALDLEGFGTLGTALQRRVLRLAISRVKGSLEGIKFSHLEQGRSLARGAEGGRAVHLPGVAISRTHKALEVSRPKPALRPCLEVYPLHVPGRVVAEAFGVEVVATVEERTSSVPGVPTDDATHGAVMDADAVPQLLVIRGWRHGDRFVPLGMQGHKKLSDFFVDEKVPREERACLPLVATPEGEVLWVVGMRIADRVKVTEGTQRILRLRIYKQPAIIKSS